MNARDPPGSVVEWDEEAVIFWLSNIGFPQYELQIREHNISGEVLTSLDQEMLKEVGVETIGQRLAILKAVYYLKVAHGVPIDPDHYVPPSKTDEDQGGVTLESLHEIVKEQSERLRQLEYENRCLYSDLQLCLDRLGSDLRSAATQARTQIAKPIARQPSVKWTGYNVAPKPPRSPTRVPIETEIDSPKASPLAPEHDISPTPKPYQQPVSSTPNGATSLNSRPSNNGNAHSPQNSSSNAIPSAAPTPSTAKPTRSDSNEALKDNMKDGLKSFKVSLEDPAWKVLPAALKKYKINNDDWQNYAMFICYGNTERCLSYDEKPLLLFQRLKDAKKNPVFMLKHIRDIRSPIVVAQQKQAARQLARQNETNTAGTSSTPTSAGASRPENPRVAALSRQRSIVRAGGAANQSASASANGSWPPADIMSPSVDKLDDGRKNGAEEFAEDQVVGRDVVPAPKDISYAVAIYPYTAEQEDEFNVVVSDTFIILQRARGWWIVQRDPAGTGIIENDPSKQGWVPAGCLLETSVPVATAVVEASGGNPDTVAKPILPLNIISTSFPGVALMDYRQRGEAELDLQEGDIVRVFKRYNHWSYAVKEEDGQRGWVPSWFIGKVAGSNLPPQTPSTAIPNTMGHQASSSMLEPSDIRYAGEVTEGNSSVSPVSPGFPPARNQPSATVF